MTTRKAYQKRSVALDFLRSIAIFLVIGRHMLVCPKSVSPVLHEITVYLSRGGWIGVDLFFVLSGFLVSGILFREEQAHGSIDIKRFFIRRGLKIYPAFWFFLLFSLYWKSAGNLQAVFGEILFLQNYLGGLWIHTWSLAVEEHFYIFLGLLLVVLLRRKNAKKSFAEIPVVFALIVCVCLFFRAELMLTEPFGFRTHMFATHLRLDSLMFGVLLSWMWHYGNLAAIMSEKPAQIGYAVVGVLLLVPAFFYEQKLVPWIPVFGVMLFYIGSGALMLGLLKSKLMEQSGPRSIARVGVYSYSIYLWHEPVNEWVKLLLGIGEGVAYNWYLYVVLYVTGALVIGYAAAKLIEYPVIKLRDRLFPSLSPGFGNAGQGKV